MAVFWILPFLDPKTGFPHDIYQPLLEVDSNQYVHPVGAIRVNSKTPPEDIAPLVYVGATKNYRVFLLPYSEIHREDWKRLAEIAREVLSDSNDLENDARDVRSKSSNLHITMVKRISSGDSMEGRLSRRTWARGVTTDYAYDEFDALLAKTYSDETPAVALACDGMGRLLSAVCEGVSTNLYSYGPFGDLTNEVQNGTAIARSYDAFGRPIGYALGDAGGSPAATGTEVEYAYDAFGRFASVTSGTNVFAYSYLPGTRLVSGMTANTGHAWERIYEPNRDLIATVHNRYGERTISRFDYTNDEIGRRIARVDSGEAFSDAAFERYAYNARSELIGAHRFLGTDLADESRPVPSRSFGYAYDPIGNRVSSTEERGGIPIVTLYESNELNQYTRTDCSGESTLLEYDKDGNTTFDGRFRYTWNAENRMIRAVEAGVLNNCPATTIDYAYDHQGRMIAKNLAGTNIVTRAFLWHDYNIVCETENAVPTYNVWGLNLDGTLQGCGGVGGLLNVCSAADMFIAFYDANANLTEYCNRFGDVVTHCEYSSMGKEIVRTGKLFTHGFCTKPSDSFTHNLEYFSRHFTMSSERWVGRDPLLESGGINLYAFCRNNPISFYDFLGMLTKTVSFKVNEHEAWVNKGPTPMWSLAYQDCYYRKEIVYDIYEVSIEYTKQCTNGSTPDIEIGMITGNLVHHLDHAGVSILIIGGGVEYFMEYDPATTVRDDNAHTVTKTVQIRVYSQNYFGVSPGLWKLSFDIGLEAKFNKKLIGSKSVVFKHKCCDEGTAK